MNVVESRHSEGHPAIEISAATKSYGHARALVGLDLAVEPGELFSVLGPSGCGKTTLLRLIVGFERPDSGTVRVAGRTLAGPGIWVPPEDRRIGMVVQDYALFPHLTVARNVAFGLRGVGRDDRDGRTKAVLDLVGLTHKRDRYPNELSGGERQRVALARALAPEPAVVLLDEPFSSLDASLRGDLRREVELILREAGATAVLVTHDQEEALILSDRLAVMRDGRVVQTGTPDDVYWHPAERWVAQFVGEVNILSGVVGVGGVRTDLGVFDLSGPSVSASDGDRPQTVHVAIRPEQLELRVDELGNAEVVELEFRGHDVMYRLRHESGRQVFVQRPSIDLRAVGDSVYVRPVEHARAALVD